jgi:acetyltransferase
VAIITNGGGPGVLAIDKLISNGGKLATLSKETLSKLDEVLPPNWSESNPIDIREDATTQRYIDAIEIAVKDPAVNGIIVIFSPQGKARAVELAEAVIKQTGKTGKPILTAWIGADAVADARQLFHEKKVSAFEFPEDAIKTYLYMWQYSRNLDMLYQTPNESPLAGASRNHLKALIRRKIRESRPFLTQEDAFRFLSTYQIPTTTAVLGTTAGEVVNLASRIGYPVVLKIASPDIYHKSDVNGVVCGVNSAEEVKTAFDEIMSNVKKVKPDARIDGVSVHNMITQYDYELIVGVKKDPICGPVIMFGLGGKDTELIHDFAVGLPPLNQILARRILEQTRVYEKLASGYRDRLPVNMRVLEDILVKVSDFIADFPEIMELDINPIAVRGGTAVALDARILLDTQVVKNGISEYGHLIISPYPTRYVTLWQTKDGRSVVLRPIKPDDEAMEKEAVEKLTEESQRFRFFSILHKVTHEMLVRFCNIDYDREMTITAEYTENDRKRSVGNSRLIIQSDGLSGEFAVVVAEDFRDVGLGLKLTDMIIGIARDRGLKSIYGIALKENSRMINLARRLGFYIEDGIEDEVKFTLEL